MRYYSIFLYIYSTIVSVACSFIQSTSKPLETLVIGELVIACLLGIWLLLTLAGKLSWLCLLMLAGTFSASLLLGSAMFPLQCIILLLASRLLFSSSNRLSKPYAELPLAIVAAILLAIIMQPAQAVIATAILCVSPLLFLHSVVMRLHLAHTAQEKQSDENQRLRGQIADVRKMSAAADRAARITERNRIATRIHDKVGHGISGSILLLEGAKLSMDKDPVKAKAALELATENLRASVDEIRAELRAERTQPSEAGLAQIEALLTKFSAQHPAINANIATSGELSNISPQVWVCIQENLTETLTNILKHSSATRLDVHIAMQSKLAKVSFKDNGNAQGYTPGMGLTAMVERCAACRGNCFFSAGPQGFTTIMTFTYLGGAY